LSNIVLQHAWDVLSGEKDTDLDTMYLDLLKEYAKKSLKYKLFLYAVNVLTNKELSEQDKHIVK
jgi:hypothetical protein